MACCDIFTIFDEKNYLIKEYAHWKLLIRNRNTTLGNCVAITKNHHEQFSDLSAEEMKDFSHVVKDVEKALSASFKYDKINYLMLMMKDKHTHFHIIPRYASSRQFAGMEWADEGWPLMPPEKKPAISPEIILRMKQEILKHI